MNKRRLIPVSLQATTAGQKSCPGSRL